MKHIVLLVDDEPNVLEALQRALMSEPFRLLTATSGAEALQVLKSASVDAVVSDQDMPGMKGTELLTKVNKLYPDTLRYMLTGRATLEVAISAINDGAISRFFTKPCNAADLATTIRHGLEHRDLMIQAKRLLKKVQHQDAIIKRIERETPGITQSATETLEVLDLDVETPGSYDDFIDELHRTLGTSHGASKN